MMSDLEIITGMTGNACSHLMQEACLTVFRKAFDKTIALGHRLDIIFHLIRVGLFWLDNDLITRNIDKAKE